MAIDIIGNARNLIRNWNRAILGNTYGKQHLAMPIPKILLANFKIFGWEQLLVGGLEHVFSI